MRQFNGHRSENGLKFQCVFQIYQVVLDLLMRRVRYFYAGFPGSSHDQRVIVNSEFYQAIETHFTDDEYIVGDSAYTPHPRIIPCFKKPQRQLLGRFQSLKATRYRLADHSPVITAAIILHNLLVTVKIPEDWMAADSICDEVVDEPGEACSEGQALVASGQARRELLLRQVSAQL
ncbi:hypothetical protein ACHHYP_20835 [Achlya hypogyna]|uniref:DDE Tnp4 domain-containing protein n=1 Tax=Achlya hypogyna TaxID=1202772 RepID=A0A1V9Y5P2_ACHHY|nr:hypothetical protein ACHHYP_20835 [Achlya hypogyna]